MLFRARFDTNQVFLVHPLTDKRQLGRLAARLQDALGELLLKVFQKAGRRAPRAGVVRQGASRIPHHVPLDSFMEAKNDVLTRRVYRTAASISMLLLQALTRVVLQLRANVVKHSGANAEQVLHMREAHGRQAAQALIPEVAHEEINLVAQGFHVDLEVFPEDEVGVLAPAGAEPLAAVIRSLVVKDRAPCACVERREAALISRPAQATLPGSNPVHK